MCFNFQIGKQTKQNQTKQEKTIPTLAKCFIHIADLFIYSRNFRFFNFSAGEKQNDKKVSCNFVYLYQFFGDGCFVGPPQITFVFLLPANHIHNQAISLMYCLNKSLVVWKQIECSPKQLLMCFFFGVCLFVSMLALEKKIKRKCWFFLIEKCWWGKNPGHMIRTMK